MATPYLDPYLAPFNPLSNITPFTYKDGATYLEVLESIRTYVNDTLVDFINENFTALGDDFETQVNTLITAVNAAIAAVIESSAETQDAILAELLGDVESLTRIAADALYAGQVTDAAIDAIVSDTAGDTRETLDGLYAGQVTDAAVAGRIDDALTKVALDATYAGQVTDAAVAGRIDDALTKAALDATYAGQVTDAAVAGRIDDALTSAAVLAVTSGYAGQVTDAAVAGLIDDALTKAALDAVYASLTFVNGFLTANGIIIPAFDTASLPDPTGFDDGIIVFDTDELAIKVTIAEAWEALGGGGLEIPAWGYISIGLTPTAPSSSWPSITIGNSVVNDAPVSVAIGDSVQILGGGGGANAVAIGNSAEVGATGEAHGSGIAIGVSAKAYKTGGGGSSNVALGAFADADGTYATALGAGSTADADYAISIGNSSGVTGDYAVAIGGSASADGGNAVALGSSASADTDDAIAIGNGAVVTGTDSAQIGPGTNSDDDTLKVSYPIFSMPNIDLTAISSYIPAINGAALFYPGGLAAPPLVGLVEGVSYFDTVEGRPLWLKTIEVVEADNVWVDATGTTVYP